MQGYQSGYCWNLRTDMAFILFTSCYGFFSKDYDMLSKMLLSLDSLCLLTFFFYRIYHVDDNPSGSTDGHLDYNRAIVVSDVFN